MYRDLRTPGPRRFAWAVAALPMFRLGSVPFPYMALPLGVFEERYLIMMANLLKTVQSRFGVVLIERDHQLGAARRCPENDPDAIQRVGHDRRPPMAEPSRSGPALRHRAIAELVGTAFLVAAVVGSGIAAQRLSPDNVGAATGAALAALIVALQPVSAAFNPGW